MNEDISDIEQGTARLCIQANVGTWEDTAYAAWRVAKVPSDFPIGSWVKYSGNPIINRQKVGQNEPGHGDLFQDKNGNFKYVFHIHASSNAVQPRKTAIEDVDFVKSDAGPDIVIIKKESFKQLRVTIP
ncbi:hypothetical protein [Limibacterium fermenti]|uniref:hypothetical protein n=1 Tax=Limibacterium fermenti TaxID=3229863 RepID=UPI000E9B5D27|nr:hypothetical protein [Porphyromonadaceae bacterium]